MSNKPLREWTLREVAEECRRNPNCRSCLLFGKASCKIRGDPALWGAAMLVWIDSDLAIARGRIAEGTPWAARDDDGRLNFFEYEPELKGREWFASSGVACDGLENTLPCIAPGECYDLREIVEASKA